jgi:arginyl-tRNA synthetase
MCRFDPLRDVSFTIGDVIDEKGVTGLYFQYSYARVQSIFRKGGYASIGETAPVDHAAWADADCALLVHQSERAMIMLLARFPSIVEQVVASLEVHTLADYAHQLAETFNIFYDSCPVLRSDVEPELKRARLALVAATAQTMRNVAQTLGLALPDRL